MERSTETPLHQYEQEKFARLWVVAILKKMIMIWWDLRQFWNYVLYSPTGPITIASQYSLNYQISKEKANGTDGIIAKSICYLISVHNSITKHYSSDTPIRQIDWKGFVWPVPTTRNLTLLSCISQLLSKIKCKSTYLPMCHFYLYLLVRHPLLLRTIKSLKKTNKLLLHVILVHN